MLYSGRAPTHHRVYGLPQCNSEEATRILLDIHQSQIGKYIVFLPLMPGDPDDDFNEGSTCIRAVVDDFGTLRRVS